MHADDLFTASKVARICSVDLKTIHNWVGRGVIDSFKTPGGHLRFKRKDILDFLSRYSYPIPEGLAPSKRRIAILAEDTVLQPLKRSLSREYEVDAYSDSVDALLAIGGQQPDLFLVNTDLGMDFLHVIKRLKALKEEMPVVAFGDNDVGTESVDFIPSEGVKKIRQRVSSILDKK
ncbi:MAG: helix-turn-helix domain-containing protein [Myxococcota bacterium]|nr:helix-turn-helix domain-containing protein [Myxococcota bacterium]